MQLKPLEVGPDSFASVLPAEPEQEGGADPGAGEERVEAIDHDH